MGLVASYVDPAHKALTPEIARVASLQCYAEGLLAGTTSVMDMWRYMEGSAAVAAQLGIRATLVPYVADAEGYDYFESIASNRALLEAVADDRTGTDGRVRGWVGLEHLLYCTPECFARPSRWPTSSLPASTLTRPRRCGRSTSRCPGGGGGRSRSSRSGASSARGPSWPTASGSTTGRSSCWRRPAPGVAHCPCSNMKLASGPARIGHMRGAGVTVGLGSDGEKENNTLDLLAEMKFASLLEKVSTLDPTVGDPWDVLAMATIEGARALGLADVTGSLEVGKRADVVTIDLRGLHDASAARAGPQRARPPRVLGLGAGRRDVWVDGRRLVACGEPLTFDVSSVRAEAQAAAEELFDRRAHVLAATPA